MLETPNFDPNKHHEPAILTELPVEVSPERALEVGEYFTQILQEHGKPVEIPVGGKFRVNMRSGHRAEFTSGKSRLTIEKLDAPRSGKHFQETVATMYERTEQGWEAGDRFLYNLNGRDELSYRRGKTLLYARSDRPLKPGVEGVQRTGKTGNITVNVTPPSDEGVITTLDNFLTASADIIEKSARPKEQIKALGRKATAFARRVVAN